MKLVTVNAAGTPAAGIMLEDKVLMLQAASEGGLPNSLSDILGSEELVQLMHKFADQALDKRKLIDRYGIQVRDLDLLAPVPRPGKVLCLGLNYRDHAAESGSPVPQEPVIFSKAASSVIGPGVPIRLPACSQQIDYEAELAVVIGRPAKDVPAERAMDHVAGYTVLNDVTARDYQRVRGGGQWTLAKSFDTFAPIGPWIVTADEIADPHDLAVTCTVSGELMQSSSTSQMVFRVPQIIEYLSACLTLEPGDVIGTGTPPGVGFARTPPRFLRPGDVVECAVEGIGSLSNSVR